MEEYMDRALALAREAAAAGEIPVGCVVVGPDGEILGEGRNRRESGADATAHAEMEAIRQACRRRGSWRLEDCALVVTLEPCPMCAGAVLNARIPTVGYGAREAKSGSCGSVIDLFFENYGFQPRVYGGVKETECAAELKRFFEQRR
ncbi:MAG: nucleoside deaminase [Oscillospiraceae bacterium]|nr:nucleoside deaminase [Oscillospiraceae bacterium]